MWRAGFPPIPTSSYLLYALQLLYHPFKGLFLQHHATAAIQHHSQVKDESSGCLYRHASPGSPTQADGRCNQLGFTRAPFTRCLSPCRAQGLAARLKGSKDLISDQSRHEAVCSSLLRHRSPLTNVVPLSRRSGWLETAAFFLLTHPAI